MTGREGTAGMRLTTPGREALDAYLATVERLLAGRNDVDTADVLSGIREHVETELSLHAGDPATVEDVTDVCERLGPPEALISGEAPCVPGDAPEPGPALALAILAVATAGIALLFLPGPLFPLGWLLLLAALLAARLVLPSREEMRDVPGRLLTAFWQAGVLAGLAVVLLGPAVFTWASAQIGGLLEGSLASHAGVVGNARPSAYWVGMAAAIGIVTGAWWTGAGLLLRAYGREFRHLLGPGGRGLPGWLDRFLPLAGLTLLVSGIVAWLA